MIWREGAERWAQHPHLAWATSLANHFSDINQILIRDELIEYHLSYLINLSPSPVLAKGMLDLESDLLHYSEVFIHP